MGILKVALKLTYELLKKSKYSDLVKMGFSDKQILDKLTKFYLKENRQLTVAIDLVEKGGKMVEVINKKQLIKAVNDLTKGVVRSGKWIDKTMISKAKQDIRNLDKIRKTLGTDSFAEKLYTQYASGQMNVYQLNKSMYSYISNMSEYENNLSDNIDVIEPIIEGYNE